MKFERPEIVFSLPNNMKHKMYRYLSDNIMYSSLDKEKKQQAQNKS